MKNKIKLYTMMKIQGALTTLQIFEMSLSFEEHLLLNNHKLLIQSKIQNA